MEIGPLKAKVWAPFWARPIVMKARGCRWSTPDRCWIIPARRADGTVTRLEFAGYVVRVIDHVAGTRDPLRLRPTPLTTRSTR